MTMLAARLCRLSEYSKHQSACRIFVQSGWCVDLFVWWLPWAELPVDWWWPSRCVYW